MTTLINLMGISWYCDLHTCVSLCLQGYPTVTVYVSMYSVMDCGALPILKVFPACLHALKYSLSIYKVICIF